MATSRAPAQEIIACGLCDKPIKQFCNSCQVSLCDDCVGKHRDEFQSLSHEIVPFADRKIQLAFTECSKHPGQRCEVHCKYCKQPICVKCYIGPHAGHYVEELQKCVERKKQDIEKETIIIENEIIPAYQKLNARIQDQESQTSEAFDKTEEDIEAQRELWQQEVNAIFRKLGSQSRYSRDRDFDILTAQKARIANIISDMRKTVEQNKIVLDSYQFSEIKNYTSKLKDYKKIPTPTDIKMTHFNDNAIEGKKLIVEFGEFRATLEMKPVSSLKLHLPSFRKKKEKSTTNIFS